MDAERCGRELIGKDAGPGGRTISACKSKAVVLFQRVDVSERVIPPGLESLPGFSGPSQLIKHAATPARQGSLKAQSCCFSC